MLNKVVAIILGLLLGVSAYAQNSDISFKRIGSNDGLSKNSITSIIQDQNNFVWIGTSNGLNRFDGEDFNVYKHNPSDATSMPYNEVLSLFQSKTGDIWIGTQNAGAFKYLPSKDKFVEYDFFSSERGVAGRINAILEDSRGNIWFGTDDGLIKYANGKFAIHRSSSFKKIRSLQLKNASELWVINAQGVAIFDLKSEKIKPDSLLIKLRGKEIRFIAKTATTAEWLIGTGTGAFSFSENSLEEIVSLGKMAVNCSANDLKGNTWIGTTSGLYRFEKGLKNYTRFTHDPQNSNSLSSNNITSLLVNRTGMLFVGTLFSGVNICNTSSASFSTFKFNAGKNEISALNNIKSILQTNNGGFLIGSAVSGIYKTDCLTKSCGNSYTPINKDNPILNAYHATDNTYWIGAYDYTEGIIQMDANGKTLFNYSDYFIKRFKLADVFGSSFLGVKSGEMWIGTHTSGLFHVKYNPSTREVLSAKRYSSTASVGKSLSSDKILSIKNIGNDHLWVGTKNGLNIITLSTGKVRQFYYSPKNNQSIGSDKINNIYQDKQQRIWVGTAGGGLNLLLKDSVGELKFKRYTEAEGLSNNIVLGILEDNARNLWISTSYGLNRLSKKDGKILNYYQDDGLVNSEFRHNATLKDKQGILYFGTIAGITYFNPANLSAASFLPSVKITDFTLFNKNVRVDDTINGRIMLSSDLQDNSSIQLRYNENIFGFRFAGLNFASPKHNRFKYRLKGFNNDWIETGASERSATYTNLPSGKYVFELMGSNQYGQWSDPTQINIKITPAPWNTWWAYLIYLALLGALCWLVYNIIIARQAFRKQLVYERNQQQIIKEVNQSKIRFFTNISHEFRTPLTLILTPLAKIIAEEKKNSAFYHIHHIMYRNADRLYRLIGQLMNFKDLENEEIDFNPESADLVTLVKNCCTSFESYVKDRNIDLLFSSSANEIQMEFDKQKVENMIYNLLSNAVNYTPNGGLIEIKLKQTNQSVHIQVKNTGEIIPEEIQDKIFDRYYTVSGENADAKKGVGIGLALTRELVKIHEGEISLASNKEEGTSFRITLPLTQTGRYRFNTQHEFLDIKAETLSKIPEIKDYEPLEKPVVVVIEDNYDLRTFLQTSLANKYEVHVAENGLKGLKLVEEQLPDLVISDVVMPEMDGLTVCYRIKSNLLTAHIPVVLLTARSSLEDSIAGTKTGADDYIPKPFNIDLLLAKSHNLIATRKKLSELLREQISNPEQEGVEVVQYNEFIEKAIKLIEANLSDPELGIEYLTDKMNMSRAQLYRKFKVLSNQTVKEFIRVVRLRNAARLISEGKLNVSEVCYETGFSSHSYFSKCFKEIYGVTPKEYAERNRN